MFLAANIHFEGVIEYLLRANSCTRQTVYAFGGEHSLTIIDVLHDVDIHRTRCVTGAALCAVLFVPLNFEKGKP